MTVLYKIPRAPCPHGSTARCRRLVRRGSLEYAHSIAPKSALLYSKKKNNELFRDFTTWIKSIDIRKYRFYHKTRERNDILFIDNTRCFLSKLYHLYTNTCKEFFCTRMLWILEEVFWIVLFSNNTFVHKNNFCRNFTGKCHFVRYNNHC